MRFEMFIHWGPVSLKGTEIVWSRGCEIPIDEYDALHKRFNPVNFNAAEWAGIAKAAGMKCLVITSKHHDGFCLWDSAATDFDIMATPFGAYQDDRPWETCLTIGRNWARKPDDTTKSLDQCIRTLVTFVPAGAPRGFRKFFISPFLPDGRFASVAVACMKPRVSSISYLPSS